MDKTELWKIFGEDYASNNVEDKWKSPKMREQAQQLLDSALEFWRPNVKGQTLTTQNLAEEAKKKWDLDDFEKESYNEDKSFDSNKFKDLVQAKTFRHLALLIILHDVLQHHDLVKAGEPQTQEMSENNEKLNKIFEIWRLMSSMIESFPELKLQIEQDRYRNNDYLSTFRYTLPITLDGKKLKPITELTLYIMRDLSIKGYRKYVNPSTNECYVYKEVILENKYKTHYWQSVRTLKDYIHNIAPAELGLHQMQNILTSNIKTVVEHLKCGDHFTFPALDMSESRYYIAFKNGIWDIRGCQFYDYEDQKNRLPSKVVCCNLFENIDFEYKKYLEECRLPLPPDKEDEEDQRKFEYKRQKNLEQELKDHKGVPKDCKVPKEVQDRVMGRNWFAVRTPLFDKILTYQELSKSVQRSIYELLGRCLFWIHEYDRFDLAIFFKGNPGTGKTTLLGVLKSLYKINNLGIFMSNSSEQFSLSTFADRFILICPEVKKKFGMNQADFQVIIEGGDTTLMRKHREPIEVKWKTPLAMAGNEPPDYIDFGGNLGRRVVLIEFLKSIKKAQINNALIKQIETLELPRLLFKFSYAYVQKVIQVGAGSFWDFVPEYFIRTRERFAGSTNPLSNFIQNMDTLALKYDSEKTPYIPITLFTEEFKKFCERRNLTKPPFTEDFYRAIFEENGIVCIKDKRVWEGKEKIGTWLLNIEKVDNK